MGYGKGTFLSTLHISETLGNTFYQVIALRSTQMVIRPIQSVWVAMDSIYM